MDNTSMDIMITLFGFLCSYHIEKMRKVNVHFRPVTENRHISNMYVDDDALTVRIETQKQPKQERQLEVEDRLKVRKDAAEETRRDGAVKKTAVQIVDEAIDSVKLCNKMLSCLIRTT